MVTSEVLSPCRFLVVDDELHITRLIQVSLERQEYSVTCACDGREAIELLEREPFDRVILDVMMPNVDGYEVLTWIRTHAELSRSWVCLMVPWPVDEEQWKQLPHQPDRYVTKPINPTEFLH